VPPDAICELVLPALVPYSYIKPFLLVTVNESGPLPTEEGPATIFEKDSISVA